MLKWFGKEKLINAFLALCFVMLGVLSVKINLKDVLLETQYAEFERYRPLIYFMTVLTCLFLLTLNYNILKVIYKFTAFNLAKHKILYSYLLSSVCSSILMIFLSYSIQSLFIHALIGALIFMLVFFIVSFFILRENSFELKGFLLVNTFSLINLVLTLGGVISQNLDAIGL